MVCVDPFICGLGFAWCTKALLRTVPQHLLRSAQAQSCPPSLSGKRVALASGWPSVTGQMGACCRGPARGAGLVTFPGGGSQPQCIPLLCFLLRQCLVVSSQCPWLRRPPYQTEDKEQRAKGRVALAIQTVVMATTRPKEEGADRAVGST